MAKKKADWQQGIRLLREGKPDKPATEDMALRYLRKSGLERDPHRKIQRLKQADVVGILGRINERLVDLNTYRPGRPRGSRLKALDAPMQAFMVQTSTTTGEMRKWTLARLAVVHFDIPEDQRENTMRRLVRWWTSRD